MEPIVIEDDDDVKRPEPPTRVVEIGIHLGPLLARYKTATGKQLSETTIPHIAARTRSMACRRVARNVAAKSTKPKDWLGPAPVVEIDVQPVRTAKELGDRLVARQALLDSLPVRTLPKRTTSRNKIKPPAVVTVSEYPGIQPTPAYDVSRYAPRGS